MQNDGKVSSLCKMMALLERIALALEELTSAYRDGSSVHKTPVLSWQHCTYVWEPAQAQAPFRPVEMDNKITFEHLQGVSEQKQTLYDNTLQFVFGHPANNALLWGARGTGKSSLVKAVVQKIQTQAETADLPFILIEIYREDLKTLSRLLDYIRSETASKFLIFCDDLSFDAHEDDYKSLKSILEGGIEGRPSHVLFYATSNRRHLLPRMMIENEERHLIHEGESIEEKISLSDRFGLWLGFHAIDQATYLGIVEGYFTQMQITPAVNWQEDAKKWSRQRGQMSGRVAYQFVCDVAGRYFLNKERL